MRLNVSRMSRAAAIGSGVGARRGEFRERRVDRERHREAIGDDPDDAEQEQEHERNRHLDERPVVAQHLARLRARRPAIPGHRPRQDPRRGAPARGRRRSRRGLLARDR